MSHDLISYVLMIFYLLSTRIQANDIVSGIVEGNTNTSINILDSTITGADDFFVSTNAITPTDESLNCTVDTQRSHSHFLDFVLPVRNTSYIW